jgi:hypothetical protein
VSKIVLPYEPQFVGHRNAEDRRKAVAEWLRQRESELGDHQSPPVVPEPQSADDKIRDDKTKDDKTKDDKTKDGEGR